MMANPTPNFASAIINGEYCVPHSVDLVMTKKRTLGGRHFTVTGVNDDVVFCVKGPLVPIVTPRGHRFLHDANGNTILHLRKSSVLRSGWEAFGGESTEERDLTFIREPAKLFQRETKMKVFLANNSTQVCDFKLVKASSFGRSWVVTIAESDTVVAQITRKPGRIISSEKFMITVSANIDYAFIVALTVTLEDHLRTKRRRSAVGMIA
ncbi:protein LURP-one-related 15-like [Arachis stenosperma]|uniref:protein LURP-one-related 15-like n=1 Tax=Arachis stenosperma TaxID=217475 RepID=UPI0025AD2403|nr:protein LURP-one-related 15-like [Arachis stenosperma]XP_057758130.1 protein LURP-one-related 15-like [Arachis stenosperma]